MRRCRPTPALWQSARPLEWDGSTVAARTPGQRLNNRHREKASRMSSNPPYRLTWPEYLRGVQAHLPAKPGSPRFVMGTPTVWFRQIASSISPGCRPYRSDSGTGCGLLARSSFMAAVSWELKLRLHSAVSCHCASPRDK